MRKVGDISILERGSVSSSLLLIVEMKCLSFVAVPGLLLPALCAVHHQVDSDHGIGRLQRDTQAAWIPIENVYLFCFSMEHTWNMLNFAQSVNSFPRSLSARYHY